MPNRTIPAAGGAMLLFGVGSQCRSARQFVEIIDLGGVNSRSRFTTGPAESWRDRSRQATIRQCQTARLARGASSGSGRRPLRRLAGTSQEVGARLCNARR
jgi:hypothetical protein